MNYVNCAKYKWNQLGASTGFQPGATVEGSRLFPKGLGGEAAAHDRTPYHHFDTEKGTPFKYLRKNAASFFYTLKLEWRQRTILRENIKYWEEMLAKKVSFIQFLYVRFT